MENFKYLNAEFFQDKKGFREVDDNLQYQLFYKHLLIIDLEYEPWSGYWNFNSDFPKIHKELQFGPLDKQEALEAAYRTYSKKIKAERRVMTLGLMLNKLTLLEMLLIFAEIIGIFPELIIRCECILCILLIGANLLVGIHKKQNWETKNLNYVNYINAFVWMLTLCITLIRMYLFSLI